MPEKTSTIWIDVTDLANWRGSLTGIQRTHIEIAKHLVNLLPVRFFSYVPERGYIEVQLPSDDQFGSAALNTTLSEHKMPNGLLRVKKAFRELLASLVPIRAKQRISSLRARIRTFTMSKMSTQKIFHPFTENDIILFLGVSWSVEGHLLGVWDIKKQIRIKVASLVYDLIPVLRPHFFGKGFPPHYTNHLIDTIHVSDILFSISESTSSDLKWLMSETNAPVRPIVKIRLGDNPLLAEPEKPSALPDKLGKFVLSVGTFEIRKNHDLLYKTWEKGIHEQIEMPHLVIAGRPGWLTHDLEYSIVNNPRTQNIIHILNECSDENLKWLYENCEYTIYPSWYEGWGLPIAESAFEGKLCLASNTSSMPEIAGQLMDYFDPYSTEQLLDLVQRYSSDDNLLKQKHRALSDYTPTFWKDTATEVGRVITQLQNA